MASGSFQPTPLSPACHRGFVRQGQGAFSPPIMQRGSAGQKEHECLQQSCGHTGIIFSSVAPWRIFVSRANTGSRGDGRQQQLLIIGSYISSPNPHRGISTFFSSLVFLSPHCVFLCARVVPTAKVTNPFDINHCVKVKAVQSSPH